MGVKSGKIFLSTKYVNALITDSSNRLHVVYLKNVVDNFFLADIEGKIYCFKIETNRIKTYMETLSKTCRILDYDTRH